MHLSFHVTGGCSTWNVNVSGRLFFDFVTQAYSCNQQFSDFVSAKFSGDLRSKQMCEEKKALVRIILPFNDRRSANFVRRQLGELLSRKIGTNIHPVYTSRKIGSKIKPREQKPPIVNQQCVVYHFKCNQCSADYVTATHVDTCINVLKNIRGLRSGKHFREQYGRDPSDINLRLKNLRKC